MRDQYDKCIAELARPSLFKMAVVFGGVVMLIGWAWILLDEILAG